MTGTLNTEVPMRPITEKVLRELAAQQECQVEIRVGRNGQHTFTRNWSPAVAAGLLALTILSAVTWIVAFVSVIR
jgi:hypothetical protein